MNDASMPVAAAAGADDERVGGASFLDDLDDVVELAQESNPKGFGDTVFAT